MKEDETRKKIGSELQKLRIKAGFTSYESFAYTHNIPRQTVYRAERGENITLTTFIELINIHNISLKDFFKDFKK